ncbi:MAG: hypothetical protein ACTHU0_18430 [Kofleriaceae bacterium]
MSHHVTDEMLASITLELQAPFDSHAVIREVTRRHPREYAADLAANGHPDPFVGYHGMLSQRVGRLGTVVPTRKVVTLNLRGEDTENQEWTRP